MSDSVLIVIPARYASSRLPGKPIVDLAGRPMIQHVWERAISAKLPGSVFVATDDDRIADLVRNFGGEVVMTATSHRNGTERVAEVAAAFDSNIVVNLQGDLPLFNSEALNHLVKKSIGIINRGMADLVTAVSEIDSEEEFYSPHTVKVVVDKTNRALYFSRAPIPYIERKDFKKRDPKVHLYKHFGIYCYDKAYLLEEVRFPEGDLERVEKLEQLRILEQGGRIGVVMLEPRLARSFLEVNTPDDLKRAKSVLASKTT